jgi:hypothetical protein
MRSAADISAFQLAGLSSTCKCAPEDDNGRDRTLFWRRNPNDERDSTFALLLDQVTHSVLDRVVERSRRLLCRRDYLRATQQALERRAPQARTFARHACPGCWRILRRDGSPVSCRSRVNQTARGATPLQWSAAVVILQVFGNDLGVGFVDRRAKGLDHLDQRGIPHGRVRKWRVHQAHTRLRLRNPGGRPRENAQTCASFAA